MAGAPGEGRVGRGGQGGEGGAAFPNLVGKKEGGFWGWGGGTREVLKVNREREKKIKIKLHNLKACKTRARREQVPRPQINPPGERGR